MKQILVANDAFSRLDSYLAHKCGLSRSQIQKLIREGLVTVNGRPAKPGLSLSPGDRVEVAFPTPAPTVPAPEDIPLKVIYEDDDLLVIDKPPGLTVHPAPGHQAHTLVNALLSRYPALADMADKERPGIVHRLDKDTSGLMVVAKNAQAQASLARQIKGRSIEKGYLVLVEGRLEPLEGAIEAALGRHPRHRQRMAVVAGGREATTRYRVLKYLDGYTLVEAMPETGRTHQIRVHFAAIGHPVFGDRVYGKSSPILGRQFLHAHRLGFRLPSTGQWREFTAELPPDLEETLARLSDKP